MRTDSTNIGEIVRALRKARKISRAEMSELIGISISHLEKIESGARRPGMDTYEKMLGVLEADVVIQNGIVTVQEKCAEKAQEILMGSTEEKALFMTKLLEFVAQHMETAVIDWNGG